MGSPATPTPAEPRKVRIGRPELDLFAFWSTRFSNLNNRLSPERNVKLTTLGIDVGSSMTTVELPGAYARAIGNLPEAEVPDLIMSGPEEISVLRALAKAGVLHDLGPILKNERWFKESDFHGNALRTGSAQGKQVALPLALGAEVILFNQASFTEANVELPRAAWDWTAFTSAAKSLTRAAGGDRPARWGFNIGRFSPTLATMAWQHGAELISEDGRQVRLDEPGTLRAVELLLDLINTHKIAPPPPDQATPPFSTVQRIGRQEFAMGSMVAGGAVWWRNNTNLLIAEMPTAEKKVVFGNASLLIGIPTRAPDLAHSLNALRAMFDASADSMFLPPRKGATDIRKTDTLMAESDASAFAATLSMARFLPGDAPLHVYPLIEQEFLFPVLRGQRRPAEAARAAQGAIDELLKRSD